MYSIACFVYMCIVNILHTHISRWYTVRLATIQSTTVVVFILHSLYTYTCSINICVTYVRACVCTG